MVFDRSLKFKIGKPLQVFCRLSGPADCVREVNMAVDPNYEFCCLTKQDAALIGYPSVTQKPTELVSIQGAEVVPTIIDMRGMELGTKIILKRMSVGSLDAYDVEAVVLKMELPTMFPVGGVLGRSFLQKFKLTVDYKSGYFTLG